MDSVLELDRCAGASERYAQNVNPEWVRLLDLLQMNVRYERCLGTELFVEDGRRVLDFLSGYCVHNIGHNHPDVVRPSGRTGALRASHDPDARGRSRRRAG